MLQERRVLLERRSKLIEGRSTMSAVTPLVTEPPPAARAGAELKAARERLGLSLLDVAFTLRIRLPYLEALEEGRISLLPGNAYALAFVRNYANLLGLDAEEMVRRFRTEAVEFNRRTELDFPVPMPERGMPAGALLLMGLVLAVGAYAGWYRLSGDGRLPAETMTAIPERLASLAEQALPPPRLTKQAVTAATPDPSLPGAMADASGTGAPQISPSDPGTAEISADPAPPVVAISPTSAAAAQLPSQPAAVGSGLSSASAISSSQATGQTSVQDGGRVVLGASADAWMMVKDRSGAVLLSRTLKAGETWPVPPRPDLLLTTGNAGGTEILVDGEPTPALGGSGSVRRDLPLDPDQIKDGKLASAVAPQLAATRPRQ